MTPIEWNKCLTHLCEVLEEWEATDEEAKNLGEQLLSEFQARAENRAEAAYEAHQERLRETGGPDDSHYRQQMRDAGRGHQVRP